MATTITMKILIGFIALLIVLRIMGKKEFTQITPVDFIYLLVLGGLMENAVYDATVTVLRTEGGSRINACRCFCMLLVCYVDLYTGFKSSKK